MQAAKFLCGSFLKLFTKWGINHTLRARFNFCLPLHMKFEELLVNLPILSWYMKLTIRITFWFSQLCWWRCCLRRYEPVTVPYQWRTKSYNLMHAGTCWSRRMFSWLLNWLNNFTCYMFCPSSSQKYYGACALNQPLFCCPHACSI